LEGGQELSLSITRRQNESDFLVKFGYRETDLRRAALLWWQRRRFSFTWGAPRLSPRYILAGSLALAVCLMGYFGYVILKSRETSGPAQTSSVQTAPPLVAEVIKPSPTPKATEPQRTKIERSTAPKLPSSAGELTRSGNVVPNLKLKDVKKIYIEIRGDDERNNLKNTLNSSGIVAATNADEADAGLKIVVSQTSISALLVNARGTVLWRSTRQYSGEPGKVISEIVKEMLSEIRRAK
jgi:hypothetical protein